MRGKTPKMEKGITLIASNTRVVGDLHFEDQLYINGHVEGNLFADGEATLVVSEDGSVAGEVRVPNVVVNGQITGDVHGKTRVELAPKARVKGNVFYKLIEMQLGASVDGQLVHTDDVGADQATVHAFPNDSGSEDTPSSGSST